MKDQCSDNSFMHQEQVYYDLFDVHLCIVVTLLFDTFVCYFAMAS